VEISNLVSSDIITGHVTKKNLESTTKPSLLNGSTKYPELFMGIKSVTPAPHWNISHYHANVLQQGIPYYYIAIQSPGMFHTYMLKIPRELF